MINRELIVNRKYDGKEPIAFEYTIDGLQGPNGEIHSLRVWFEKVDENNPWVTGMITNNPLYRVFTFIGPDVYQHVYQMPKPNMSLEMIVATGLANFQAAIKEEVQYKSLLDFLIGDLIKDM